MLYPQNNAKRKAIKLDGIWQFKADPENRGLRENWAAVIPDKCSPMPVPSAFNEMTDDKKLRNYMGAVWYFTYLPEIQDDKSKDFLLRFGSIQYHAEIFINGEKIAEEHLGKIPFEVDLDNKLKHPQNLLAIRVDTTLNWQTLPPGTQKKPEATKTTADAFGSRELRPEYHFDFLNFGGILRSVWLLELPTTRIEAIRLSTISENDTALGLRPAVTLSKKSDVVFRLYDAMGKLTAEGEELLPKEAKSWSPEDPYLYQLEVEVPGSDVYRMPVGLRCMRISGTQFLLNGKPQYLTGAGLHEDFILFGQGHSDHRMVKDLTRLKAMGANSFRTAHYPYDETAYQLADQLGLLVIDETPAVGQNAWWSYPVFTEDKINAEALEHHKRVLKIMIDRDNVHPSVIMWSVANEVSCEEDAAEAYFKTLFDFCKEYDPEKRPVTLVQSSTAPGKTYPEANSKTAKFCDVLCWNRYYAWYQDHGHLEDIDAQVLAEAGAWHEAFPNKPLMLTEFGADAIAGMHAEPPTTFSEEYQKETIRLYCEALDKLDYVIGEHVWNFADFMTKEGLSRVGGNKKGIHTRERQPKMAAHYLKERWQSL